MRTQVEPVETAEPTAPKRFPPVTDAYRKAHKNYVLVSGLLASWELIGISLSTKEKWGIELKSPTAVPLILFTLIFYSGYKMTIEWLQCDAERRKNKAAKVDYGSAHLIAVAAIGISIVQYLAHIRIADVLAGPAVRYDVLLAGCVCSLMLVSYSTIRYRGRGSRDIFYWMNLLFISFAIVFSIVVGMRSWKDGRWHFVISLASGLIAGGILVGFHLWRFGTASSRKFVENNYSSDLDEGIG